MMYSSNQERWDGYCDGLGDAGLEVDESIVRLGSNRSIWGMIATEQLIKILDLYLTTIKIYRKFV